jgi:hypothetical protein
VTFSATSGSVYMIQGGMYNNATGVAHEHGHLHSAAAAGE